MSPSRQQTTHNETTKETYDNMDGEQQKNLSTPRSSTTYSTSTSGSRTTTMTSQEQQKRQEHQQQLDKEATTTGAQQQQQQATGNYYNFDINALVQSALAQAKVDPEVVRAAAHLFVLANQARNNGYFVDANSNVVDVTAANRSSAMSLSNLLLPDEANSSSKATNDAAALQDGVRSHLREEFVKL